MGWRWTSASPRQTTWTTPIKFYRSKGLTNATITRRRYTIYNIYKTCDALFASLALFSQLMREGEFHYILWIINCKLNTEALFFFLSVKIDYYLIVNCYFDCIQCDYRSPQERTNDNGVGAGWTKGAYVCRCRAGFYTTGNHHSGFDGSLVEGIYVHTYREFQLEVQEGVLFIPLPNLYIYASCVIYAETWL